MFCNFISNRLPHSNLYLKQNKCSYQPPLLFVLQFIFFVLDILWFSFSLPLSFLMFIWFVLFCFPFHLFFFLPFILSSLYISTRNRMQTTNFKILSIYFNPYFLAHCNQLIFNEPSKDIKVRIKINCQWKEFYCATTWNFKQCQTYLWP
jgi:hypothetical protein